MTDAKTNAIKVLIHAMQGDALELLARIDLAAEDITDGSSNGAIGALAPTDELLERLTCLLGATRAMHRKRRG